MKNFRNICCGLAVLILLAAPALHAQGEALPQQPDTTPVPTWAAARKIMQTAFANFIQAAAHDDKANGGFNTQMQAILNGTHQIHRAEASLADKPGNDERHKFAVTAVMCQRAGILFWQHTSSLDRSPGHFYLPPPDDVNDCTKKLAAPEPAQ